MIPVPQPMLKALAQSFGARFRDLSHFGGGHESSDGVVYAYPYRDGRRLLKIMALPAKDQSRGLFCLDERLKFMRFLGENGASIAFPRLSPQGNLYETHAFEQHLWVGYGMDIAPRKGVKEDVWNPAFFRRWGQTVGLFIAYRRILLFTVMNDWIRSKPEWRAGWMDMILSSPQVVGKFKE